MSERLTGRCACGAVRFKADIAARGYGQCECATCRRWCSGPWMGVEVTGAPQITGDLRVWASSARADRASCPACGTSVWFRVKGMNRVFLNLGMFDDQAGWTLLRRLCADERPKRLGTGVGEAPAFTGWGMLWAILTGRMPRQPAPTQPTAIKKDTRHDPR